VLAWNRLDPVAVVFTPAGTRRMRPVPEGEGRKTLPEAYSPAKLTSRRGARRRRYTVGASRMSYGEGRHDVLLGSPRENQRNRPLRRDGVEGQEGDRCSDIRRRDGGRRFQRATAMAGSAEFATG
jgi:hypothetical protein